MSADVEVHPLAAVWPMLSEPDLRRLAADIAENGQLHPILLDADGLLIDGRNRLAACRIAKVEPKFETYEGDPMALVLSAEQRRHQSTGQFAMGTALILAKAGKRKNGRWERGSVPEVDNGKSSVTSMAKEIQKAGTILDHASDLAEQVIKATLALDAAYRTATENREHSKLRSGLPADLGALVDAGDLPLDDALRRARLPEAYQTRVGAEELTLSEAEHLATRDAQEHKDAVRRQVGWIGWFLGGWDCASTMRTNQWRDEVLADLDEYDRNRFLTIEKGLK